VDKKNRRDARGLEMIPWQMDQLNTVFTLLRFYGQQGCLYGGQTGNRVALTGELIGCFFIPCNAGWTGNRGDETKQCLQAQSRPAGITYTYLKNNSISVCDIDRKGAT